MKKKKDKTEEAEAAGAGGDGKPAGSEGGGEGVMKAIKPLLGTTLPAPPP